jgi:hypothetical protein
MLPETEQVAHTTTTLPQTETTTNTKSSSTTAATTQADTTGSVDTNTTQKGTETPLPEATTTTTDDLITVKTEDATEKLPSSTDNEVLTTQSDVFRGNNNAAETIVLRTSLLMISVAFALNFIIALYI